MIERETNNTVVTDRNGAGASDASNPLVAILILGLVIIASILLWNYYGRDTSTDTGTTDDNGSVNSDVNNDSGADGTGTAAPTTAPTTSTTPSTQTTQ